ncbi:hypothetical protein BDK51DRAFT_44093 [Blyttiomyces helicus]|uniref:Uncharacterized protein n=1 Tax=Blyttiomyces helicus TaxID=388810 RepID=A0A4P9WPT2_9FUNG|nr:hypothetical protein BDK51DRAFT_44093 [Blyttiomyces helicus]|eukprot:RKO93270.1 hypothetical protein BDK51DRAFT_44093 [Blyttiomyces helicus]
MHMMAEPTESHIGKTVAVALDESPHSVSALKWTFDHILDVGDREGGRMSTLPYFPFPAGSSDSDPRDGRNDDHTGHDPAPRRLEREWQERRHGARGAGGGGCGGWGGFVR